MTLVKQYTLQAREGQIEAMAQFLIDLASKTRALEGSARVEVTQDRANPSKFHYSEYWLSDADRLNAAEALGKSAFAPLAELSQGKPISNESDLIG